MVSTAKKTRLASSSLPDASGAATLVKVCGRVGERLLVEHPTRGTVEALTTLSLSSKELATVIKKRHRAVAVLCDETLVVTGILRSLPPAKTTDSDAEPFVINAPKGLVLRSGASSIRIMPDGRILLRGKRVISRAELQNHIIGGSIRLN